MTTELDRSIEHLKRLTERLREAELERPDLLALVEQCADAASQAADELDRAARTSARDTIPDLESTI